jgi:DNA-binding GntR family transcriptional regulator
MAYIKKKSGSKQEIAYQKIKDAILNNQFEPESMLNEGELCAMLGFSKTPIREALRRLASEKFVESIPEKGTFVSRMGLEDFIETYDIREALEGMAVRRCVQINAETVIKQLKPVINHLYSNLVKGNNTENVDADMKFHNIIIIGSKNSKLIEYALAMHDQICRFAATTIHDITRLKLSYEEHQKVFEAIVAKDADLAEKTIREHIRSVKEYQIKTHYLQK